jgi:asparagine synthase (glutamine-hydrolysing)
LMDHELVQWVASLPSALKLKGSEGKYLFKKAMEPRLPNDVLYRPKMGFAVPLARWFRGPLRQRVRDSLLRGPIAASGLFNIGVVQQLITEHEGGKRDHSTPLWTLLMFDAFLARETGTTQARLGSELGLAA